MKLNTQLIVASVLCVLILPLWASPAGYGLNFDSAFVTKLNVTENLIIPFILGHFILELPFLWFFTDFSFTTALIASIIVNGIFAVAYAASLPSNFLIYLFGTRWSISTWPTAWPSTSIFLILIFLIIAIGALEFLVLRYIVPLLGNRRAQFLTKRNIFWLLSISLGVSIASILIVPKTVSEAAAGVPLNGIAFSYLFLGLLCLSSGYKILTYTMLLIKFPIILYVMRFAFLKTVRATLLLVFSYLYIFLLMAVLMPACDSYYFLRIKWLLGSDNLVTLYSVESIYALIYLSLFTLLTGLANTYVDVKILQKSFNIPTTKKIVYWLLTANILSIGTISILLTQVRF